MQRMYTEQEARRLAVEAAEEAIARFSARRPVAPLLSVAAAADTLGISVRTIARMKPPKVGGKIPYSWVVEKLEV